MSDYFKSDKINLHNLDQPTFFNSKIFHSSLSFTSMQPLPLSNDLTPRIYLTLIYLLFLYILFNFIFVNTRS